MAEALEAQLDRIQTRIAQIENGASEFQTATRRLKNHELNVLYDREKDLIKRIAMQKNGNTAYVGRPTR
ncbi:MAG: hypothetical protein K0Q85_21 [Caproiciproducens sp.]|nr:hypothetical protein [Caproiciproducens sp.]